MTLVRNTTGNLLRGPTGLLTQDLDCCCIEGVCDDVCLSGTVPPSIDITISGMGDGYCPQCDPDVNGTWQLPFFQCLKELPSDDRRFLYGVFLGNFSSDCFLAGSALGAFSLVAEFDVDPLGNVSSIAELRVQAALGFPSQSWAYAPGAIEQDNQVWQFFGSTAGGPPPFDCTAAFQASANTWGTGTYYNSSVMLQFWCDELATVNAAVTVN